MDESFLKKKSTFKRLITNRAFIACISVFVVCILLTNVSFALLEENSNTNENSVVVNLGSLEAVVSLPEKNLTLTEEYQKPVSNEIGLKQESYNFKLRNTGTETINYFEIRLFNQEGKISTLTYDNINYSVNDGIVRNLGIDNGIIYTGTKLEVDETKDFSLKLWIKEDSLDYIDKTLYTSIELTLYQEEDIENDLVFYNTNTDYNPVRTFIYEPITEYIPIKEGYKFIGWSNKEDGEPIYESNTVYAFNKGLNLYAIYIEE